MIDLWELADNSELSDDEAKTLIRRRRAQMLVHSYLYYHMDEPIISDDTWQKWADELTKLQADYPKCVKIKFYDKEFTDWDGSTGMHLPSNVLIQQRAQQVMSAYHLLSKTEGYL